MITYTAFKGMNNKAKAEQVPEGFVRNAVNVVFSESGQASRIQGVTKRYSGSGIHSYHDGYFIEGSSLKRLESDYTATTLGTVGSGKMGFAQAGGRRFAGNGKGWEIIGNTVQSLGIPWPEQQPNLIETNTGGLFAGTYQVAISYKRSGEESGFGQAASIEVSEGSGIMFTMPTVPADIDEIAIWLSSVNDDGLYLYDEVPAYTTQVFIENDIALNENATQIEQTTQFMYPPDLSHIVQAHYGRLYWADGNVLRWTEAIKYGLTKADNYAAFGGDIHLIVSVPGALYVCADKTYRLANIDGEGFMQRVEVLPYGAASGAACYDPARETAYWLSHQGIVAATAEGAQELIFDRIALPQYDTGTIALTTLNNDYHLMAIGQGGTVSPLMDPDFKTSEIARKGNAL